MSWLCAFGAAKVRFWRRTRERPQLRQVVAVGGVGAAAALAARQVRHPRRLVALATLGIGALALVDHVAEPRERRARVRAHSVVASVCIVGAWVSGVAQEALGAPIR